MEIWNEAFWLMGFLQRSFWEDYIYQESLRYPVYEFESRLNTYNFNSKDISNFQFQSRSNSEYSWEVQQ